MKKFKRIKAQDFELQRVQENAGITLDELTNIEILNGNLISVILSSSDTQVAHKLHRPALGYFVVRCSSPGGIVFDSATINSLPNEFLILKATATVTVTLWIF